MPQRSYIRSLVVSIVVGALCAYAISFLPLPAKEIAISAGPNTISPVYDWVIDFGGNPWGLNQWGACDCTIYMGTRIATVSVPAPVVAVALVACALCLILTAVGVLPNFTTEHESGA